MSTAQRLQEDYLTCTLCQEPFKQPKTLPCLHNFCKQCLAAYLDQEMGGERHTTFSCPQCNKKIYVPDASKAVARWAAQFPTNFTLSGMVEAIAQERSGEGQGMAMVKAAKERRGAADLTDYTDSSKKSSEKTSKRAGSFNTETDIQLHDTQARLSMLNSSLSQDYQEISKAKATLHQDLANQKDKLNKSFSRILELLDSRKGQLMEELNEGFNEELERLQQTGQSYRNDLESTKSCLELLNSLESRPVSDDVLQEMLEAINEQTKEIEARPANVNARRIRFEQTLEAGRSILRLVEDLGHVTISTEGEDSGQGSSNPNSASRGSSDQDGEARGPGKILMKPRFLNAFQAKGKDGTNHQVYDITVMPSGTVVMTAYAENLIQAARKYANGYEIFAQLQLDSEPKCIASVSQYYAAVVGPSCIYIVAVGDKLTLKKTVHTGKDYSGIAAYTESSLILSSTKPSCIDFVDLSGFISETIDRDHTTGSVLFKCPQFISSTSQGVIYVTDSSRVPRLFSVNNAGKVRFQFPADGSGQLEAPQGVASDSQGHVYVVDRGAQKVLLLTPTGEKVKDILTKEDGLTDPCAICIDKNDLVFVTNEFSEILVFQIK